MTTGADTINWKEPIAWVIAACCVMEAGMNAAGGYDLMGGADGGLKAKVISAGGVIVAFLGAWMAAEAIRMWRLPALRTVAAIMIAVAGGCFLLSQGTAYRVLSSSFADGAAKRADKAGSFEGLLAEKKGLGPQRPVATIEADLDLELRKTSAQYPKGDGPKATKLRGELAAAKRVIEIDGLLDKARKGGGVVAAGSENLIMSKLGLSNQQSIMLLVVLLAGLIGFFAYFGFAILALTRGWAPATEAAPMYDPVLLPPPANYRRLGPPDIGSGPRAPQMPPTGPGGQGGAQTNIFHVGPGASNNVQALPPRIAARRSG